MTIPELSATRAATSRILANQPAAARAEEEPPFSEQFAGGLSVAVSLSHGQNGGQQHVRCLWRLKNSRIYE